MHTNPTRTKSPPLSRQPSPSAAAATASSEYLNLAEASRRVPGRPSMWAVWRWCRKGVKVRGGTERIFLQHIRVGGKLFTTRPWLDAFGVALAEADTNYFAQRDVIPSFAPASAAAPRPSPTFATHRPTSGAARQAELDATDARLDAAGL